MEIKNLGFLAYSAVFICSLILFLVINFEKIGNDSATILIIGSDIAKGNYPYENFWDIKPPLIYYLASLSFLSDNLLISVLVYSAFLFITSAYIFHIIAKRLLSKSLAIPATAIFLLSYQLFMNNETLITEQFLLIFLLFATHQIIFSSNNFRWFNAGVLICILGLTKTNFAALAVLLPFYILLFEPKDKWILYLISFVLGGFISLVLFLAFFSYSGEAFFIFLKTFFLAPFDSSGGSLSINFLSFVKDVFTSSKVLFFFPFFYFILLYQRQSSDFKKFIFFGSLVLTVVLLNILRGPNDLYILSTLFLLVIFLQKFIEEIDNSSSNRKFFLLPPILISLVFMNVDLALQAKENKVNFKLVNYLKNNLNSQDDIFIISTKFHYLYLLLDKQPISSMVHPSNFYSRESWLKFAPNVEDNHESELLRILLKYPKYILIPKRDFPATVINRLETCWNSVANEFYDPKDVSLMKLKDNCKI